MSKTSRIGLVDCNNFFVSCERLFRPDLTRKPVIVLSSNDGCVISRSAEVKHMGIPMGIPFFEIKDIAKERHITIFSSNFELYRDISARVMETVVSEVDDVEVYSIDEAFFHVTEDTVANVAQSLKYRIESTIGIPVSVGVGKTKTLAKLAGREAKQGVGVHCYADTDIPRITRTPLREVWGVGKSMSHRMEISGLHTVGDVLKCGPVCMRRLLGVVGERLFYELSGVSSAHPAVHRHSESIMSSKSFGKRVTTYEELEDAVSYHLTHTAEKLRAQHEKAHEATLYVRYRDEGGAIRSRSERIVFSQPLSDTRRIAPLVLAPLCSMYSKKYVYLKAGIVLSHFVAHESSTGSLFEDRNDDVRHASIVHTMDVLNARFGKETVRIGTMRYSHAWLSKRAFISPSYTTSWTQLPTATLSDR